MIEEAAVRYAPRVKAGVLLVDDDEEDLRALAQALKDPDLELVLARSGREALDLASAREFAAILLDVRMPGLSGLETAARLRRVPASSRTPLLFVTAYAREEGELDAAFARFGGMDCLVKPVREEALRAKISVLAELFRRSRQARERHLRARLAARAVRRRLIQTRERLQQTVAASGELLFAMDLHGRLREVCPVWEKAVGRTAEELFMTQFLDCLEPEDRRAAAAALEALRSGQRETAYLECRLLAPQGPPRRIAWTLRVSLEERRIYGAGRDVTDLESARAELRQFLALASHELREPLRRVASFAQMLAGRTPAADPAARTYLKFIGEGIARLQAMLADILEYSQADSTSTARRMVSLDDAARRALWRLEPLVLRTRAKVDVGPLPEVPGDPGLLTRLFENLLENALKFAGSAPPEVEVDAESHGEEWTVSVRDNGIGIEPRHQERIFAVFKRLHPGYPGLGFGLALCRKIVERHGGRIWVESAPGRGSVFRFTLPGRRA